MECVEFTATGKKCTRKAKNSEYCWQHEPEEKIINTNNNSHLMGEGVFVGTYTQEINKKLIKQVLPTLDEGIKIDSEALDFVNFITYRLYEKFSEYKTIEEFTDAVFTQLPKILNKYAYNEIISEKNRLEVSGATREQILDKIKISLIEFLTCYILQSSVDETNSYHRSTISYQDVQKGLIFDENLKELIDAQIPGILLSDEYFGTLHNIRNKSPLTFKKFSDILQNTGVKPQNNALKLLYAYIIVEFNKYSKDDLSESNILVIEDYINLWLKRMKNANLLSYKNITDLILTINIITEFKEIRKNIYINTLNQLELPKDLINNVFSTYI